MKILSYFSCLLSTSLYFKSHYVNYDEVNRTQLLFIIITSSQATRRAETEAGAEAVAEAVDNASRRRRRRRRKAPTQKEFVASPDPESNSRHKGEKVGRRGEEGGVIDRVAGVVTVKFGEYS